jgi:hypothetical protein
MAANFMANSMLRILKKVICAILGLAAIQHASAFSVYGPAEAWQTITLDYLTRYYYGNDTEVGATKNFGEGSRLNVPTITYGYDYTFLTYFGAEGVAAVDSAMNLMNGLPASSSVRLSKFLTQGNQAINYTAQALSLTDIKSTVMSLMLEHMGLIGESHVWDLRLRSPSAITCEYGYTVINRNYDPATYNPTPYVNGVRVGYTIWDGCTNGIQVADAIETTTDQTASAQYVFSAVATRYGQQVGGYYLGVTRDDIGGLAYLYNHNNYAYESLDTNSVVQGTSASAWSPINPAVSNVVGTNFAGLLGGVEKITYLKVGYDSLLGSGFTPLTYSYTIPIVTNNRLETLRLSRTITQPDIIFAAGDLSVVPFAVTPDNYPNAYIRTYGFIASTLVSSSTNPVISSVITPQEIITFNNGAPAYFNASPSFLDSQYFIIYPTLQWASFNGTTNAPIIFPNSKSIAALMQQVLTSGSSVPIGVYNPVSILGTNTTTTVSP